MTHFNNKITIELRLKELRIHEGLNDYLSTCDSVGNHDRMICLLSI